MGVSDESGSADWPRQRCRGDVRDAALDRASYRAVDGQSGIDGPRPRDAGGRGLFHVFAARVVSTRGEQPSGLRGDDHEWGRLDRSEFASANLLLDGGLEETPIAEAFLPTHRCRRCGLAATT